MSFKVSKVKWLEVETARIADIITGIKYWHRAWTDHSLKQELDNIGLHYSMPEIELLNDSLHESGIVEDVNEE